MIEPTALYTLTGALLILIGFAAIMLKRNLIKMMLGFVMVEAGVHLLIICFGYIPGRTAPIINAPDLLTDVAAMTAVPQQFVDPVVQAIVLTAIVIAVGVTALMLAYVVRLYGVHKTLDVGRYVSLKW
ncbi:MAG: cation:proton antiporter subunit C [Rhodospirillales bacterium]|jgi:multisubunit Na+/H+ antiporter MnhC subunit|nr:cation:proton antiporter subunit C [Rhodospirillales bacterium]